ncbi:MAG: NAD(+)/NADH kinase [Dehalococcoidia bacterium]|nr:NAD(+)/NADH kinase [Dehalococcoidia bacterium]
MTGGPVGIVANPASGKDIRRLVARASVFDNQEKAAIVARAFVGAIAAGATSFRYLPDRYGIVAQAIPDAGVDADVAPVDSPDTDSALDTIRAAAQFRDLGCAVVLTLGGDGTNRAVARGWRDAPLVAISTGTNNVFPRMIEGTVAGAAAGLVASGAIALAEVARPAKLVTVTVDGERDDLALVDAVLVDERFLGARAIWDASRLRVAVLTRAEPASVGVSAIGGLLRPLGERDPGGLALDFGSGGVLVDAPIAPGLYQTVPVRRVRPLAEGEPVVVEGPGVLALDGERERVLKQGQRAILSVVPDGPRVVDVRQTLHVAACRGLFRAAPEGRDGD